jgi:hypothetical protein
MKDHDKQQQTALLAYQFWMDRGCPDGSPAEDWFRAERSLHSRQSEEVAADATEEAPAHIAADPPDSAGGSTLAVAVSSR